MLNRYSFFQLIYGCLLAPTLISIFIADRIVSAPLIWIKTPTLKEYFSYLDSFIWSIYRVTIFVLIVMLCILIKLYV